MQLLNRIMYRTVPKWLVFCKMKLLNTIMYRTVPNWLLCYVTCNCWRAICIEQYRTGSYVT